MEIHMDDVNIKLKSARLQAGITIEKMASICKVSVQSLKDREAGHYPFSVAMMSYYGAFIKEDIYIIVGNPCTLRKLIKSWL